MNKERLEEIKKRFYYFSMMRTGSNEQIIDDLARLIEQAERVQELEEIIKQADYGLLASTNIELVAENKRYRAAIEKLENKIKFNNELIKHYSRDDWYSDVSHRRKVLDGETYGMEIALEIINKTLEGEE